MGFRRALPVPPVLADGELRRPSVPALFLLGARGAMHHPHEVADRLDGLVPSDRPDLVIDRILHITGR
ncbi:hypothetical protein [Streptomyces hainanensis]|uniref:Alpha/beta hydrolase n=1 Tax=Streptomyces hainanensis TaxID=402648 RepID=A0A4R4T8S9_9ACTN|nr:hypothetical protein [Streptomyces hainanensis]TDC71864.1 hypothetical protein E1283_23025 [Streptomyces hainanensis]